MHSLRDEFHHRLNEFETEYEWREHGDGAAILQIIGELIERMTSAHHASIAIAALSGILGYADVLEWDWSRLSSIRIPADWRRQLQQAEATELLPGPFFFDRIHDLNAFAHFGILPGWNPEDVVDPANPRAMELLKRREAQASVAAWIEATCAEIDALEQLLPARHLKEGLLGASLATRTAARARLAYDKGEALTVAELAALSGVSMKRLQNAIYSKTDEAPLVGRNGRISVESAKAWLDARDYRPSIWQAVERLQPLTPDWGEAIPYESYSTESLLADHVFIPVANDGSEFRPDQCWRRGKGDGADGYVVGPKGAEKKIADFFAALDLLARMETPRWRRPNPESGNWGIVTGQSWRRVTRESLEVMASSIRDQKSRADLQEKK